MHVNINFEQYDVEGESFCICLVIQPLTYKQVNKEPVLDTWEIRAKFHKDIQGNDLGWDADTVSINQYPLIYCERENWQALFPVPTEPEPLPEPIDENLTEPVE